MQCVAIDATTGAIMNIDPQPADTSSCTLVLASPAELSTLDLFRMDLEDQALICAAIAGLWALAWSFRLIVRQIQES